MRDRTGALPSTGTRETDPTPPEEALRRATAPRKAPLDPDAEAAAILTATADRLAVGDPDEQMTERIRVAEIAAVAHARNCTVTPAVVAAQSTAYRLAPRVRIGRITCAEYAVRLRMVAGGVRP